MLRCYIAASVFTCVLALTNNSIKNEKFLPEDIKLDRHHVVTKDLYVLDLHRIQNVNSQIKRKKNSVLIFHGLYQSSDRFVEHGRNLSLAYSLADAGFDVWLGNNRGNKYSRKHIFLNPDDEKDKFKFYNFTYEEIGVYDVAATVDYILHKTKSKQLHYIGYSQGGSIFFALNSLQPEYNDKFLSANLLSGAGFTKYFPNEKIKLASTMSDLIYKILLFLGVVKIFPLVKNGDHSIDNCLGGNNFTELCQTLNTAGVLGKFGKGEGAIKQMAHFGQNIESSMFSRWNYGKRENIKVYGTKEPPKYNLGLITVESTLHYALADKLVDARDVIDMAKTMPNAKTRKVARDDFGHSDYVDAADAKELVYDFIIDKLTHFERENKRKIIANISCYDSPRHNETDSATSSTLNATILMFALLILNNM